VRWKYWRNRCAKQCLPPPLFVTPKRLPIRISRPSHKKFHFKNKIVPQYLYCKIKFISERQNYNLRNCRNFDIKFSRYDIRYNSAYYEGLRMYNKLPIEIKNCTIILKFKQLLRVYKRENF
jgi:hypothetical protein